MAVKKSKGIISHNWKKYINDVEVKPTRFVHAGGRSVMGGSVDGEMVLDNDGKVIPFHNIVADRG